MKLEKVRSVYKVDLPQPDLRLLFIAARFHGSRLHDKMTSIRGVSGVDLRPHISSKRADFSFDFYVDESLRSEATLPAVEKLVETELAWAKKEQPFWQEQF